MKRSGNVLSQLGVLQEQNPERFPVVSWTRADLRPAHSQEQMVDGAKLSSEPVEMSETFSTVQKQKPQNRLHNGGHSELYWWNQQPVSQVGGSTPLMVLVIKHLDHISLFRTEVE